MEPLDYWRLAEDLNVIQAALLFLGLDPGEVQNYVESSNPCDQPTGYVAVSTALKNAVKSKKLAANITYTEDQYGLCIFWKSTLVKVDDIKNWLRDKGMTDGFFVHQQNTSLNFLNPKNEFYAPKLAAAYFAWQTISLNDELLDGKTPKQAMDKWLRENASQYGLTKDDGNPNESAIEEISKIANWNLTGGVAKTPTKVSKNPPTS